MYCPLMVDSGGAGDSSVVLGKRTRFGSNIVNSVWPGNRIGVAQFTHCHFGHVVGVRVLIVFNRCRHPPRSFHIFVEQWTVVTCPRSQAFRHFCCCLDPLSRIFLHHVADQINEFVTDFFVKPSWMPGSFLQMSPRLALGCSTGKWNFTSDRIVKRTSERINITDQCHIQRCLDLLW